MKCCLSGLNNNLLFLRPTGYSNYSIVHVRKCSNWIFQLQHCPCQEMFKLDIPITALYMLGNVQTGYSNYSIVHVRKCSNWIFQLQHCTCQEMFKLETLQLSYNTSKCHYMFNNKFTNVQTLLKCFLFRYITHINSNVNIHVYIVSNCKKLIQTDKNIDI